MSFLQVNHVLDWMYRGSDYVLKAKIYKECSTEVLPLIGADVVLQLHTSDVEDEKVLELDGVVVDDIAGEVEFTFEPEHTVDLLARSYALTIYVVDDNNKVIPAVHGAFGIVATGLEGGEGA